MQSQGGLTVWVQHKNILVRSKPSTNSSAPEKISIFTWNYLHDLHLYVPSKPLTDSLVYPPWRLQPAHFYTRLSFPSEWTPLRRNKTIKDTWELLRGGGRHRGEFIQGETEAAVHFTVLSGVNGECAGVRAAIGFLSADHVKEMMKNPLKPQRVQLLLTVCVCVCVCVCVFACDTAAHLSGFQADRDDEGETGRTPVKMKSWSMCVWRCVTFHFELVKSQKFYGYFYFFFNSLNRRKTA